MFWAREAAGWACPFSLEGILFVAEEACFFGNSVDMFLGDMMAMVDQRGWKAAGVAVDWKVTTTMASNCKAMDMALVNPLREQWRESSTHI